MPLEQRALNGVLGHARAMRILWSKQTPPSPPLPARRGWVPGPSRVGSPVGLKIWPLLAQLLAASSSVRLSGIGDIHAGTGRPTMWLIVDAGF